MRRDLFEIIEGRGPIVATAVHAGHELRPEIQDLCALSGSDRLREEDPYTDDWTGIGDHRIVVRRSRFEVDLNRPRAEAVYRSPEDAWGLTIWRRDLPQEAVDRSLSEYDDFYAALLGFLARLARRHGCFLLLNLHSYNHRREGPTAAPAAPELNPEINIGTGTMDRSRWGAIVDGFIADLTAFDFGGRKLDVRENVKFRGRQLDQFVHENFPASGVSLAVEVKKFFMDEWLGEIDERLSTLVKAALASTLPGIRDRLARL